MIDPKSPHAGQIAINQEFKIYKNDSSGVQNPLPFSFKNRSKFRYLSRVIGVSFILSLFLLSGCGTYTSLLSVEKEVKGKTFVIVGASSWFGRGVAEQLGAYKANVVLAARNVTILENIADNIRAAGGSALVLSTDISKPEDVKRLTAAAVQEYGNIDVWMNMTEMGGAERFWNTPIEEQAKNVDVNLKGFIYASYAAIQQFRLQNHGKLVNVGSIESATPLAYNASHAAIKGGIINLGQALNQELQFSGLSNIRVITVEPWAVDALLLKDKKNNSTAKLKAPPQEVVDGIIQAPFRRKTEVSIGWKAQDAWLYEVEEPPTEQIVSEATYPVVQSDGAMIEQ